MRYFLQRTMFYLIAFWIAITLNFALPRIMPGDPLSAIIAKLSLQGGSVTPESRAALEAMFGGGSDTPILVQYGNYLASLSRGDLGLSFSYYPSPVLEVIVTSLPWTVLLVGTATVVSFLISQALGILAGWWRGRAFDTVASPTATVIQSVPYFWLAIMFSYLFYKVLGWFPRSGGYDYTAVQIGFSSEFVSSALYYAVLPAMTIIISSIGAGMVGMRNMMVSTMGEDYVITAEAKGLSERRVMLAYAARNAILPSISGFAIALGFVVGGSVLTETVFAYPGVGTVLLTAVQNNDYALMQGIFLAITVSVLIVNFVVDLLYGFIDPRTRQST